MKDIKIVDCSITSIGSTSLAMTTSWAFFFSTRVTTLLTPCLITGARFVGASAWKKAVKYSI